MFSLLVSGNGIAWETDQLMRMDKSRFKEYSSGEEAKLISLDDSASIRRVEVAPALLVYELGVKEPNGDMVRYGYPREIRVSGSELVFRFEEIGTLKRSVVSEAAVHLQLGILELGRTHWAIKDGNISGFVLHGLKKRNRLTEVTRRELIDSLLLREMPFHGKMDLLSFLRRVWNLASMPSTDHRHSSADGDIVQHMVLNDDWDVQYLLYDYLGLVSNSDEIFIKFMEAAVHPLVCEGTEASERVSQMNKLLAHDGFRLEKASEISSRPVFKVRQLGAHENPTKQFYDVVVSFAGEDRAYVEEVVTFLQSAGVRVFYDRLQEATLWGQDLATNLDTIYRQSGKYCVMFISKHYAEKVWTNHERSSALARAIIERQEYILPARFDDTEIPGIKPTIGYVDLRKRGPAELGRLILEKLGRTVAE